MYAVGGAQAIAMFAYGAGPCRKVDLVTGPGNIYTVSAKRLLKGTVGIDSEAGPTEIAILADETADPAYVAADLLSQAEHDPMAAAVLVTTSTTLADEVEAELDKQVSVTRHVERIRTVAVRGAVRHRAGRRPRAGPAGRRRLRRRAPRDPDPRRRRRWPAGSATPARSSSGSFAPVSLGDYCAGSNHVLPTGGCACHSSGLSVRSFRKALHVIEYDEQALRDVAAARRDAGRGRGPARSRRGGPRARRGA